MPRVVKAVTASKAVLAPQKLLENDADQVKIASSANGFLNGVEVKKTTSKGRGRGAKKDAALVATADAHSNELEPERAELETSPKVKARGRKKVLDEMKNEHPEEEAQVKKLTAKGRAKKTPKVALRPATEEQQEAPLVSKEELAKEVTKGRKAAKKLETIDELTETTEQSVETNGVVNVATPKKAKKPPKAVAASVGRNKKELTPTIPESATDNSVDTVPVEKAAPAKKRSAKKAALAEDTVELAAAPMKPVAKRPVKEKAVKKEKLQTSAARIESPKVQVADTVRRKPAVKRKSAKENAEDTKVELENVEAIATAPTKKVKKEEATDSIKPAVEKKAKATKAKKGRKAAQDIVEEDEKAEDHIVAEKKPRGRKRAAATVVADDKDDTDDVDGSKPTKAKKPAAPLNATATKYDKAAFALAPSADGETPFNLKISSWNVSGLRAWLKKDGLRFLEYEEPDIFCMQEIKCTSDQLPDEAARIPGYHPYWLCMPGGYAGVAIYSKIMPIHVEYGIGNAEFDDVGRIISAEYEKFYLINVYVPNSGRKLVNLEPRMRWEQLFQAYVQKLDARKPVVICGDMNVSHQEIDLANPKTNTRNAGFTKEERDQMSALLALGYVDTFRQLYPQRTGAYTFWTYMGNARARNVGWRLDYFIVSERFNKRVVDNCIRAQVLGSDHCPITLFLKL